MSIYGVTGGGGGGGASINDATVSQSSVWSSYRTAGALAGKVTAGGSATLANLVVGGNLTVSGTVTTVNSETLTVNDAVIDLNNLAGPAPEVGIRAVLPGEPGETRLVYDSALDEWACSTLADGSLRPILTSEPTADLLNGYPLVWNAAERVLNTPSAIPQLVATSVKTPSIIAADPQDGLTIEGVTVVGDLINGVDISARDALLTTTEATANGALQRSGGTMTGNIAMGANSITLAGGGLVDGVDISARDAVLTSTTTTASGALQRSGGVMTGNIAMGANSITLAAGGLVDGVDISARDALLTVVANTANSALQITGGTMTGTLAMGANSITLAGGGLVDGVDISARDALLTVVANTANSALQITGGTMTGNIAMGANSITLAGGGLVDGVDVSARDAVLTSTTTTASGALQRSGGVMTGPLTVTSLNGLSADITGLVLTPNGASPVGQWVNASAISCQLRRVWSIDATVCYLIKLVFTMSTNASFVSGYGLPFTGYGGCGGVLSVGSGFSPTGAISESAHFSKYSPDFDSLCSLTKSSNFSNGTTYTAIGLITMAPGFD